MTDILKTILEIDTSQLHQQLCIKFEHSEQLKLQKEFMERKFSELLKEMDKEIKNFKNWDKFR